MTDEFSNGLAPPASEGVELQSGEVLPPPEVDKERNEHSLPNPEELKIDSPSRAFSTVTIGYILVILLLAGAVVGLSIGLTADNRGDVADGGSIGSAVYSGKDRRELLTSFLTLNNVNKAFELNDPTSPQSRALKWVADEDTQQLAPVTGGLDNPENYELLTRYVMALFYYAMKGSQWHFTLLFLTNHKTCEWFELFPEPVGTVGVICDKDTDKITGLSFIENNLEGTLPKELGHLTTMTYLESINNSKVQGTIPSQYSSFTDLRTLVFAFNQIQGTLPSWLGDLTGLEFVYLSNNNLEGTIPQSFSQLTNMIVLALDDNKLSGPIDVIWDYAQLEYLYLEDNEFTGQLPASITATSPFLLNLDLSNNQFNGPLPDDLFKLVDLEVLDLHGNGFTGKIPSDIILGGNTLLFLALHENELFSTIPTTIANLDKLTHLDLSKNFLTGTFPTQMDTLDDLSYLFLSENEFTRGEIPPFFFSFNKLRELSLKSTNREGEISELVELLDEVRLLDLDSNYLTGTIPYQLAGMRNLEFLLLNRNDLTGPVPMELGQLNNLRFFLVDRNNVTGSLEYVCDLDDIALVMADCGEVTCDCCDPCCDDETDCHDYDLVANLDPTWESGYERKFYDFSDSEQNDRYKVDDDDVLVNSGGTRE